MGKEEQLKIFTEMFCNVCHSFGFSESKIFQIIQPEFDKRFYSIKLKRNLKNTSSTLEPANKDGKYVE